MGWCSGTDVFDAICEEVLKDKPLDKKKLIIKVIEALEDKDWDCQNESEYWRHPTVIEAMKELHPNWFEDEY